MKAEELLIKDYPKLDENCTISEFIGLMIKTKDNYAFIFSEKKYLGYADKKSLMKYRVDVDVMKVKKIVVKVPKLNPESDELEMAKLFSTSDAKALPVFEKEKFIGVVKAKDLVYALKDYYKKANADEMMSNQLLVLNEDDEIGYALSHMKEKNVHRAPVVDDKNDLSGIISLIDLFTDYYLVSRSKGIRLSRAASHQKGKRGGFGIGEKQNLLKLPLKNIMTNYSECCCCSRKTNISEVIELMKKDNVSSVVIVEKSKPVGIITFKDVLTDFAKR